MSNLTSVTLTSGVPTAGTGTVSTLDAVLGSGPKTLTDLNTSLTTINTTLGTPVQNSSIAAKGTVNAPAVDYISIQAFASARTNRGKQLTTISNTSETTIITAAASTFNDIYFLGIWNNGATAANCTLRDDTAGTIWAVISVPAGGVGGFRLSEMAPMGQALVNKPWTLQADASTTLKVTAIFIKNTV